MTLKAQNLWFGGLLFFLASETVLATLASTFSGYDKTLLLYTIPSGISALTFFWVILLLFAVNRPEVVPLCLTNPRIHFITFATSSFIWSILTPLISTQSPYGCEDNDYDEPRGQLCGIPVSSAVAAWMIWAFVTVCALISQQGVTRREPKPTDDNSEVDQRASSVTFSNP
ncbi:hypothetical protein BDN72DRAFT_853149 [Pluteus cervinus]|uniref:Uncharacterized protein n=1 Tax=Pluteus cervinus TaxID=181527 RepID=A0ACD3BET4_9AGAR|nr:hypothetical protein BDN72DRAFT_853149 [Pluteus cervinus]